MKRAFSNKRQNPHIMVENFNFFRTPKKFPTQVL